MTSKERMILQFQMKETDRVPVGDPCINSKVASEILGRPALTGMGGSVHLEKARLCAKGARDEFAERFSRDTYELHEKCDLDYICCELVPGKEDRCIYKFETDDVWTVTDPETGMWWRYKYTALSDDTSEIACRITEEGEDAIDRFLDFIRNETENFDSSILQNVQYCLDQCGDRRFIFARPPYVYPAGMSWYTTFLELMIADPEIAQDICDTMLARTLKVIDAMGQIGTHGLFVHGDWAGNQGLLFSPNIIRTYLAPQMRKMSEAGHKYGMYFVKHTDGNIMQIAEEFCTGMGFDGFQSVDPGAGMSMKQMKELYGDKILLMGNVDCGHVLPYGTEQEIIDATIQCIREGARGGGFCLTSSNSISGDITAKRFMTMVEAAKKYGQYPISV